MRSLRLQLVVSNLLLVLLMAAVTAAGLYTFIALGRASGDVLEANVHALRGARLMGGAIAKQETAFAKFTGGDPGEGRIEFEEAWKQFGVGRRMAEENAQSNDELVVLGLISSRAERYELLARDILKSNELIVQPDAAVRVENGLGPIGAEIHLFVQSLSEALERSLIEHRERERIETHTAIQRSIFVTCIAILLAILLAIRMIRMTFNPLKALAARAERIASGDLSPGKPRNRKDEIGTLLSAFDEMAERLSEIRRQNVRRLMRAERMSDAALEHLYDPVLVTDGKGRIAHMNRAAQKLFGPTVASPRAPLEQVVHDRRVVRAIEDAVREKQVLASEDVTALVKLEVEGVPSTFRLRVNPMYDDESRHLGSVVVLEDVTHLRELDRLKTEFIGVAAHELRTPVTSLMLSAQLLDEGAAGPLTDDQKEIVQAQKEDLKRLEKLMRDLLDVTRLEAGATQPKLEVIDIAPFVQTVVQNLKSQAEMKPVIFSGVVEGEPGQFRADRGQITRVLTNLLANAIRHTPAGGSVSLRASASEDEVTFSVEDTGEGIPKGYLERIFDRFVQVPGATQGGAGLGLSIAQNIVRAHGGRMNVDSEVGKGSVFTVTLPRDPAATGREDRI